MTGSNNLGRRKLLKLVGGIFSLSVTQLQHVEITSAETESLLVNQSPFTEVSISHEGFDDVPLTVSCGSFPYEVSGSNVCLVDHNPSQYRALKGVASVNGSVRETGEHVSSGETRHIPVSGDLGGRNFTSLRLPDGNSYNVPNIRLNHKNNKANVRVDGEKYELSSGGKSEIELSEREFTVSDTSGDRERTFSVSPSVEIFHYGEVDILGKEDHYVFPEEFIEKRSGSSNQLQTTQSSEQDVVVIPSEVIK